MKKLICMTLALVLMLGMMVLPVSAEETMGKLYKLPFSYSDFIGMGGNVIVVGKTVEDANGESVMKYGAVDYTGNVIVPFEYDWANAPDPSYGTFLAGKIDLDALRSDEYIIGEDFVPVNIRTKYGIDGFVGVIDYDAMARELSFLTMDSNTGVYSIKKISTNTNVPLFEYTCSDKVTVPIYGATDGTYYAYSDLSTLVLTDGVKETVFTKDHENEILLLLGFDSGNLYFASATLDSDTFEASTTLMCVNAQSGRAENLTERYGIVDVAVNIYAEAAVNGKMIVANEQGKYAYMDFATGVNTGYIFDMVPYASFTDYIPVIIGETATYYTLDGKPTNAAFYDCSNFSNGMAFVTANAQGETFAIDKSFERISQNALSLPDRVMLYCHDGILVTYSEQSNRVEFCQLSNDPDFQIRGDANGDERVDVTDIIFMKNGIMSGNAPLTGDLNGDGSVDVQDIIALKLLIMSN